MVNFAFLVAAPVVFAENYAVLVAGSSGIERLCVIRNNYALFYL